MSKKNRNPNRQGFMNRVEDIRTAENDVDKVLQAARLKRIESGKGAISAGKVALVIAAIVCLTAIVCIAVYMDLSRGTKNTGFISFLVGGGGIIGIVVAICVCCCKDD